MVETTDLTETLAEALPLIDRALAERDIALKERPLSAAIEFVSYFVHAVREGETPEAEPGEPSEFLATQWFASLYGQAEKWYGKHYPGAMEQERHDRILGIVMIAGTAFAIRVPAVRRRPGRPGETVWISFPDGLREGERALDWIDAAPNLAMLSPKELRIGEEFAAAVANDLRFIRTGLMAVSGGNNQLDGFRAGVMPRLHRAAELLLEPGPDVIQQAFGNSNSRVRWHSKPCFSSVQAHLGRRIVCSIYMMRFRRRNPPSRAICSSVCPAGRKPRICDTGGENEGTALNAPSAIARRSPLSREQCDRWRKLGLGMRRSRSHVHHGWPDRSSE